MNYFLLIASSSEDIDGNSVSALEMAHRRLDSKTWGLWANTPHKKEIASGDMLLIYIAGARGKQFIGIANAAKVTFGKQSYTGDGNALTDPPCAVLSLTNVRHFEYPVLISGIKDKLNFIPKNVIRWGCVLQRGVKRISRHDAAAILEEAKITI